MPIKQKTNYGGCLSPASGGQGGGVSRRHCGSGSVTRQTGGGTKKFLLNREFQFAFSLSEQIYLPVFHSLL